MSTKQLKESVLTRESIRFEKKRVPAIAHTMHNNLSYSIQAAKVPDTIPFILVREVFPDVGDVNSEKAIKSPDKKVSYFMTALSAPSKDGRPYIIPSLGYEKVLHKEGESLLELKRRQMLVAGDRHVNNISAQSSDDRKKKEEELLGKARNIESAIAAHKGKFTVKPRENSFLVPLPPLFDLPSASGTAYHFEHYVVVGVPETFGFVGLKGESESKTCYIHKHFKIRDFEELSHEFDLAWVTLFSYSAPSDMNPDARVGLKAFLDTSDAAIIGEIRKKLK